VLIPSQRKGVLSTELIVSAVALFAVVFFLQRDAATQRAEPGTSGSPPVGVAIRRVLGLGSAVLIAIAGLTLAAEVGGGLYWWPVAVLAAYLGALTNAWVLLIEILR
jgi:modulator of FtsH protease